MILENYSSRKFIIAIILLLISTVYLFVHPESFAQWIEFNKWLFGIYAATNAGAKAVTWIKEKKG